MEASDLAKAEMKKAIMQCGGELNDAQLQAIGMDIAIIDDRRRVFEEVYKILLPTFYDDGGFRFTYEDIGKKVSLLCEVLLTEREKFALCKKEG